MRKFYSLLLLTAAFVCLPWSDLRADELTVADGTATDTKVPFEGMYADTKGSRTQVIYPASSLEDLNGSQITALTFYSSDASASYGSAVMKVSLKAVDQTEITYSEYKYCFTTISEGDVVYEGALAVVNNELTITLTTPFAYVAGKSILLDIEVTTKGSWKNTTFYGVTQSYASAIYTRSNASTTGSSIQFIPKTTFEYETGGEVKCPKPTDVAASGITSSSATISWTKGEAATSIVEYKLSSASEWTVASSDATSPYNLIGLTASSDYDVRVKNSCGTDGESSYQSLKGGFSTPCAAIPATEMPYEYGFEDVTTGSGQYNIPDCWNRFAYAYSAAISYPYVAASPSNAHGGSKSLYFYGGGSTSSNTIILPAFETPNSLLSISFWYKNGSTYSSYGNAQLGYVTNLKDASTFVPLETFDKVDTYTQVEDFALTDAPAGSYIAIRFAGGTSNYGSLYIDDITVSAASCPKPSGLTITDVTTTSANISWTKGEAATSIVEYKLSSASEWTVASSDATSPYNLTSLTESTHYDVRVTNSCGTDGESKPISDSFFTPCPSSTIDAEHPYTQNFDELTTLPDCWEFVNANGTNQTTVLVEPPTGAASLNKALNFNGTNAYDYCYALLPPFTNATSTLQIAFSHQAESSYSSGKIELGYYKDGAFTLLHAYDLSSSEMKAEDAYVLTGAPAGSRIAFRYKSNSSSEYANAVDDITVSLAPSCTQPTAISIPDSTITTNSAKVHWTKDGNTKWNLQYKKYADSEWTSVNGLTDSVYTLTSLTASTQYNVQVQADCGSEEVSEWKAGSFMTVCDAISTLPWNTDATFAAITEHVLPICWSEVHTSGYITPYVSGATDLYFFGNNNKTNSSYRSVVVLPEFEADIKTLKLTFKYATTYNDVGYPGFQVGYIKADEIGDASKFHPLTSTTEPYRTTGISTYATSPEIPLYEAEEGARIAICFTNTTTTSTSTLQPKDGKIQKIIVANAVDCSKPETPVASDITGSTAHIAWTAKEGVNSYQYCYVASGSPADWSGELLTSNNYVDLAELTTGQAYDFYVKCVCGGEPSDACTFTPICATPTDIIFSNETYNGATVTWTKGGGEGSWNLRYKATGEEEWNTDEGAATGLTACTYALSGLTTNTTYTVEVQAACGGAWASNTYTPIFTVPTGVAYSEMSDTAVTVSWNAVIGATGYQYELTAKDGTPTWPNAAIEETSIRLKELNGGTAYDFHVRAIFAAGNSDPAVLSFTTACIAPKNIEKGESTGTTAVFTWLQGGAETQYQWACVAKDAEPESWSAALAENVRTVEVTGLEEDHNYDFCLRSYYGEDKYSALVRYNFYTECATKAVGWSEDFDAKSSLPNCWQATSQWIISTTEKHSGSYSMRYATKSGGDGDLTLPAIALDDKAELSFWYRTSNVNSAIYANSVVAENKLADFAYTDGKWKEAKVNLSAYKDQTVTLIIRGNNKTTATYYLYVDDVAVNYLPVETPTDLTAAAKNAAATVTWESDASAWILRYRVKDAEPEAKWDSVNVNVKSYELTALTNETEYEIQVQAVAAETRKSEWTASTLVTPTACPSVTEVTFGAATYNSVVVNWVANGETDLWALRYSADGGENWTVASSTINELTYTLSGLATNTAYTIAVKAACGGDGTWFAAANTHTPVYTAPVAAEAANITETSATVAWSEVSDAGAYEYTFVQPGNAAEWNETTELSATASNLLAGTDYLLVVRSKYPTGVSGTDTTAFKTTTVAPVISGAPVATEETATISMEAYTGVATQYQYVCMLGTAAADWENASLVSSGSTNILVEGLTPNKTQYTFYVRAYYSETVQSAADSKNFTTACSSIATTQEDAWQEGFEDDVDCWQMIRKTSDFVLPAVVTTAQYEGEKSLRFSGSSSKSNAIAVLPRFAAGINNLKISFYYKNGSAYSTRPQFGVGYITDPEDAATYSQLQALERNTSWTNTGDIDLSAAPAGAYIAICYYGGSDNATGYVDNVVVTELPSCRKPKNVQVSNILYNEATITWEAGNEETAWYIRIQQGDNGWSASTLVENTPTYTYVDLETGYPYQVQVQAACGSEWVESSSLTPDYAAPTNVTVTDVTTSGATVSWTANSGEAAWTLQYKKVTDSEWTSVAVAGTPQKALTELAAGTSYSVRVLADTKASATESFNTECPASVAPLGWTDGFEAYTAGTTKTPIVPNCWSVIGANEGDYPYVFVTDDRMNTGSKSLEIVNKNEKYAVVVFPAFNSSLEGLQIAFSHKEESSTNSGDLELGYLTDAEDSTTFVVLKACAANSSAWQPELVNLSTVPTDARLAFRYISKSAYDYWTSIDDLAISEVPACDAPTGLAYSEVTANSAKLSWTSDASAWKVEYSKNSDFSESTVVNAAANPYTLAGLSAQTTYYARVAAVCGLESESEYCAAVSFTTECEAEAMPFEPDFTYGVPECWKTTGTWATNTEYAHSAIALGFDAKNHTGSLTTPKIAISEADAELIYYFRNVYGGSNYVGGKVTITDGETTLDSAFVNASNDNLERRVISLAAFNGKTVTITFSINSVSSTAKVYIGDIRVVAKPCAVPTNLSVEAGNGSATFTWNVSAEEETVWQLQYKAKAAEEWTLVDNITATTYALGSLTNGVEYQAQVRSYCDETHQSEWVDFENFTPSTTTGVGNTDAEGEKAYKVVENGHVVIIRNGEKRSILGTKIE